MKPQQLLGKDIIYRKRIAYTDAKDGNVFKEGKNYYE